MSKKKRKHKNLFPSKVTASMKTEAMKFMDGNLALTSAPVNSLINSTSQSDVEFTQKVLKNENNLGKKKIRRSCNCTRKHF